MFLLGTPVDIDDFFYFFLVCRLVVWERKIILQPVYKTVGTTVEEYMYITIDELSSYSHFSPS